MSWFTSHTYFRVAGCRRDYSLCLHDLVGVLVIYILSQKVSRTRVHLTQEGRNEHTIIAGLFIIFSTQFLFNLIDLSLCYEPNQNANIKRNGLRSVTDFCRPKFNFWSDHRADQNSTFGMTAWQPRCHTKNRILTQNAFRPTVV